MDRCAMETGQEPRRDFQSSMGRRIIFVPLGYEEFVLLPATRLKEIELANQTVARPDLHSWGDFKKLANPEIYWFCFEREYKHRGGYGMVSPAPEIEGDEELKRFFKDEDNRSFFPNLGHYVIALHRLQGAGKEHDGWMPRSVVEQFPGILLELYNTGGIYVLKDASQIGQLRHALGGHGYRVASQRNPGFTMAEIVSAAREDRRWDLASRISAGYPVDDRDVPLVYHTPSSPQENRKMISGFLLSGQFEYEYTQRRLNGKLHGYVETLWQDGWFQNAFIEYVRRYGYFASYFLTLTHRSRLSARLQVSVLDFDFIAEVGMREQFPASQRHFRQAQGIGEITEMLWLHLIDTFWFGLDQEERERLEGWMATAEQFRQCRLCGASFRLGDLPSWLYCGSNGVDECCFQCEIVEWPAESEALQRIRAFVDTCGFIPNADAGLSSYAFTNLYAPEKWEEVFRVFARIGRPKHIKQLFGSWFKGLALAGILPNGVQETGRGLRCLAQDGHECASLSEQIIDNWLHRNGIPHEREPLYPQHDEFNPRMRLRADWRIDEVLVEFFGLSGEQRYDQKTERKLSLARVTNTRLLTIFPNDLGNLEIMLSEFLPTYPAGQ